MSSTIRDRHDLGEIVGLAYRVYGRHFAVFFAIAATTAPLTMLGAVLARRVGTDDPAYALVSLAQLTNAVVTLAANGALVVAVHRVALAQAPEFGASLDVALERFLPLLRSSLLGGVLAALALGAAPFLAVYWLLKREATIDGTRNWWLALVPGVLAVYLAIRWVFTPQVVMIEGKQQWAALDDSARIVRGTWWRVFGILLVITLIEAGPIVLGTLSALGPPLVEATVTAAAFTLVFPFAVAGQTLLYYDLNARKEPHVSADRITAAESDVPG